MGGRGENLRPLARTPNFRPALQMLALVGWVSFYQDIQDNVNQAAALVKGLLAQTPSGLCPFPCCVCVADGVASAQSLSPRGKDCRGRFLNLAHFLNREWDLSPSSVPWAVPRARIGNGDQLCPRRT